MLDQHPHAAAVLGAALDGAPAHAYLLHGPAGSGKRDAARDFPAGLLARGASDPESARYRAHVADTFRRSPNTKVAEEAARRVLAGSKHPELRVRALKTLGVTQYFLQNLPGQAHYWRAAFQEHPCQRCRDLFNSVNDRIGQEWGIE